jgi:hypothetical protein
MALSAGTRIGPYEVVALLGEGGSACGHAERERSVTVSSRWGWGPSAIERM